MIMIFMMQNQSTFNNLESLANKVRFPGRQESKTVEFCLLSR
uniref:Uncharacterized protein n=1 Tax=Rhizophora mucronata TaxID=61149 RepID=A0A2P2LLR4_RHIMU